MKINEAEYNKLVSEAESALAELVKAEAAATSAPAAAPLAKAEEPAKEAKADDKKDEKKDDKEDKCDYDDSDMEEMHKMYSGMGKAELGVHKSSLEKAWVAKCGDVSMQKSEQPLAKSEDAEKLSKAEGEVALAKAEAADLRAKLEAVTKEADTAKKEVVELKKTSSELGEKLHEFLTKKGPQRKAVTSIEVVAKSEAEAKAAATKTDVTSLTKSEITSRLSKKACEASLSTSDREAINKYCLVPGTPVDTVKHLLS